MRVGSIDKCLVYSSLIKRLGNEIIGMCFAPNRHMTNRNSEIVLVIIILT